MKLIAILLLCLLFNLRQGFSQTIYTFGNLQQEDCERIKNLISNINNKFKVKSILLFNVQNPSESKFQYYPRNSNSNLLLKAWLDNLNQTKNVHLSSSNALDSAIQDINSVYTGKKQIKVYDATGSCKESGTCYNDWDQFINYIQGNSCRRKDLRHSVLLLNFKKELPGVHINVQKETGTSNFKITGTSLDRTTQISRIEVNVNNKGWEDAIGTNNWSKEVKLKVGLNHISARAENRYGSWSLEDSSNVTFAISSLNVQYISPNENSNLVKPCDNAGFSFKFKWETDVSLSNINLVIEDSDHAIVRDIPISISNSESLSNCFYMQIGQGHEQPPFNELCFDPGDKWYYYFKYINSENNVVKSKPILIHFQSFIRNKRYFECDCN